MPSWPTRADDAYERVVDRLLASPHYGERWGRHWLDAARYADSDGYEKDKSRFVWFYRDWVVNALNRDLPYDRFVIEQIAGDQLPGATQDQVVATGFLRNSMINEEGGIDPEQFRMEAMFDRMDAIGKSILGLTIQCAQCHIHKYDPITQEEYYRLFAFLNNDHEAQPVVYTPEQLRKVAELSRRIREIEARLRHTTPDWRARMAKWEESVKDDQPRWVVLAPTQVSEADTRFIPQEDGSLLAQGYAPAKFTYVFEATSDLPEIRAFRLELLTDPNLPANGPGRSFKGTCTLTEFQVEAADAREPAKKSRVKLVKATADFANEDRDLEPNFDDRSGRKRVTGRVEFAIDGKDDTAWGIDAGPGRRNTDRKAVFVAEKPIAFPAGTRAHVPPGEQARRLEQQRPPAGQPRPVPPERDGGQGRGRRPAPQAGARDPGRPAGPAVARPGGRRLLLLADDRPRVQGGQRADRGPLRAVARGDDGADLDGPRGRPHDQHAQAGRLAQARQGRSPPACPPSCTRSRTVASRRG